LNGKTAHKVVGILRIVKDNVCSTGADIKERIDRAISNVIIFTSSLSITRYHLIINVTENGACWSCIGWWWAEFECGRSKDIVVKRGYGDAAAPIGPIGRIPIINISWANCKGIVGWIVHYVGGIQTVRKAADHAKTWTDEVHIR
jgi:hypothetical protein